MKWYNKGHQFDKVAAIMSWRGVKNKKIYIYGSGEAGKEVYQKVEFLDCVVGFIDLDLEKQKMGYMGKPVFGIDKLKEIDREEVIIICAVSRINMPNIVKKLVVNGFVEGIDFFDYRIFIEVYLPVFASYVYGKVYHKGVTFIPTRKCPLNCQNCLNFIPYDREPAEDNIESVKKDLDMLFSRIDCLGILSICGGEIFLYSAYKELFQYVGQNYRRQISTLSITTSAAIVPDDETFQIFKEFDFVVHISDYRRALPGLEKKYNQFVAKAKEFGVQYVQFEDHEWLDLGVFREKEIYSNDEERIEHFDACGMLWGYYKNGKIHACSWAGHAIMTGARKDCETDYYDLENNNGRELMEFGMGYSEKGYVNMCSKCNGGMTINKNLVPPAVQMPR